MKLAAVGINGRLFQWLRNFLVARTYKVGVRGMSSKAQQVLSGVPQGSVLGPILFLLFVNEVPSLIKNAVKMFADDTKYGLE